MPKIIKAEDTNQFIDKVLCPRCNRPMSLQGLSNVTRNRRNEAYLVFKDMAGHHLSLPTEALKYGGALLAVAQTGDVDGCISFMIPQRLKVKERFALEVWEKTPKRRGPLTHARNRTRQEAAEAVERWLRLTGYDKWIERVVPKPRENKEIEGFDEVIVSRATWRNEGQKVVVAVAKFRNWREEASYHEVLWIELSERRLADEIVAGLSDFLVARLP